jgi:hypothetical protein
MSKISRKNGNGQTELVRPTFIHHAPESGSWSAASCTSELAESIRNVCEEIRDMIQTTRNCGEVRQALVDIRKMRIALEKIARNTAKPRRKKEFLIQTIGKR